MSTTNLPRSRLNEIARRKLAKLGIPSILSRDQQTLEAELVSMKGRLANPFNAQPIESARFRVVGHDHAMFVEPPVLRALAPVQFYDLENPADLVNAIALQLKQRFDTLAKIAGRLKQLGYLIDVNGERGVLMMKVHLNPSLGAVILEGDTRRMFAVRLIAAGANDQQLDLGRAPIDYAAFGDKTSMELHLSKLAQQAKSSAAAPGASGRTRVPSALSGVVAETGDLELQLATSDLGQHVKKEPAAPKSGSGDIELRLDSADIPPRAANANPPRSLSLQLLAQRFGATTLLGSGLAVAREVSVGAKKVRFEAKHIEGLSFIGRAILDDKQVWSEQFDLEKFAGFDRLAESLVGALQSKPLWMMRVLVEREEAGEVRYVGLNADGQAFGATRVLTKDEFHAAFQQFGPGYRLLARVLSEQGDTITYVLLDPKQEPIGASRTVAKTGFVAQFSPVPAGAHGT